MNQYGNPASLTVIKDNFDYNYNIYGKKKRGVENNALDVLEHDNLDMYMLLPREISRHSEITYNRLVNQRNMRREANGQANGQANNR
jgi:hypothetical protein